MSTETALLDELLEPVGRIRNRTVLEQLVNLRAPSAVQSRLDEFAVKSTAGTLTREVRVEYESLVPAIGMPMGGGARPKQSGFSRRQWIGRHQW